MNPATTTGQASLDPVALRELCVRLHDGERSLVLRGQRLVARTVGACWLPLDLLREFKANRPQLLELVRADDAALRELHALANGGRLQARQRQAMRIYLRAGERARKRGRDVGAVSANARAYLDREAGPASPARRKGGERK